MLENIKASFDRLSPREKKVVALGTAVGGIFILSVSFYWVGTSLSNAERRVKAKTEQLVQILALEDGFKAREVERISKMKGLEHNAVRLVSVVEEAARQSGVEIGQLTPEDGAPNKDGVVESRLQMKAANLSIDRVQDFMGRLEKTPGVMIVRRLDLKKPYKKDTLDLELSLVTYKRKS